MLYPEDVERNDWKREYLALREGAAVLDFSARGKIAFTGEDRVRWLHGMVSNDIKGLAPGQGCYCFVLDAQGHIRADANVYAESERLILDCAPEFTDTLATLLDGFIIMDQVEMSVTTAEMGTLSVEGPKSGDVLAQVDTTGLIRYLVPRGTWLWGSRARLAEARGQLESAGAIPAGEAAYEVMRIEAGILRAGVDTDASTIANETGCMRALHFNKGCYIGQEIVERVRSRGQVKRIFAGFLAEAEIAAGSHIEANGSDVGRITSAAFSPGLDCWVALGYVRREYSEPGGELTVGGHTVRIRSIP
jgi:folate-binding protein YgfZ